MTISRTQLDQALSEAEIKRFWLGYFQEGFREEIHQQLLEAYETLKERAGFTRADLARKIGRRPEQVTRWLSAPTNLESDTISDMALGLGLVPKITFEPALTVFDAAKPNRGNAVSDFVADASVRVKMVLEKADNRNATYEPQYTAASS